MKTTFKTIVIFLGLNFSFNLCAKFQKKAKILRITDLVSLKKEGHDLLLETKGARLPLIIFFPRELEFPQCDFNKSNISKISFSYPILLKFSSQQVIVCSEASIKSSEPMDDLISISCERILICPFSEEQNFKLYNQGSQGKIMKEHVFLIDQNLHVTVLETGQTYQMNSKSKTIIEFPKPTPSSIIAPSVNKASCAKIIPLNKENETTSKSSRANCCDCKSFF